MHIISSYSHQMFYCSFAESTSVGVCGLSAPVADCGLRPSQGIRAGVSISRKCMVSLYFCRIQPGGKIFTYESLRQWVIEVLRVLKNACGNCSVLSPKKK